MTILTKEVNDALVWYDTTASHRWIDAIGVDVAKHVYTFCNDMLLTAADAPLGWTVTLVEAGAGDSTVAISDTPGGALLITTDAAENDGVNMQFSDEPYLLDGVTPCYFGIKFQISEATQSDFIVGLCITDTTLLGGMTHGVYFRKVDATTNVEFVTEKDSVESTVVVDTAVDATNVILEFYYDGTHIVAYADGVQVYRQLVASLATFPEDEQLTPSIHFLTGAESAETMTVDWLRVFQAN
jgi:hypothetical protein